MRHLGMYDTAEEAGRAFAKAKRDQRDPHTIRREPGDPSYIYEWKMITGHDGKLYKAAVVNPDLLMGP